MKNKLIRILQEILSPGFEIEDDATLEDLGADSLDLVEVGLAIEDDFAIEITPDEVGNHLETTTVAEIVEWLEGRAK